MSKVIEKLKLSSVPLENDLADALEYWQKFKKQNGKAARLGYEPRDIESKGAKTVISTRVLNASSGFDEVDEQYSYEAIVLRYANEFPNEVVAAAKKRLKKRSYWWVNHKQTFEQEVGGDYIWSPITRSDGNRNHFYDNMQKVRRGDIVFSYANRKIQAVGICFTPVVLAPKPNEFGKVGDVWQDEGWKVEVAFKKLDAPLEPKAHMDKLRKLLPEKYSPIRANGDGNQGAYLASISGKLANALIDLIGSDWSKLSFNDESVSDEDTALGDSESVLEATIKNRTDIGETEKLTLVRARRGQGQYRRNLENFEKQCRVTGVTRLIPIAVQSV